MKKLFIIGCLFNMLLVNLSNATEISSKDLVHKKSDEYTSKIKIELDLLPSALQDIVVGYLIYSNSRLMELMRTVKLDDLDGQEDVNIAIDIYLQEGSDINYKNSDGTTLVILATKLGLLNVLRHLCVLKNKRFLGVDINARDKYNQSALMYAAHKMADRDEVYQEIIKLLTKAGAKEEGNDETSAIYCDAFNLNSSFIGMIPGSLLKPPMTAGEIDSDDDFEKPESEYEYDKE